MKIIFTHECDCGGEANYSLLDLNEHNDNEVKIDISLQCSQIELKCNDCYKIYYIGDIDIFEDGDF